MSDATFSEAVDQTVAAALLRRRAYRRPGQDLSRLPATWRARARAALAWKYRTHFGVLVTGLVARASDSSMNPMCLQVADGLGEAGRFNPTAVWQTFYSRAVQAGVATNGLKRAPHNNATYWRMGATVLRTPISNNKLTIEYVGHVHDWLRELGTLDTDDALAALDAFLVEVPDRAEHSALELVVTRLIHPEEAFVAVEEFIVSDTENGRRGQAFMVACLNLLHGSDVQTSESVHDPSRSSLGDATLRTDVKLHGVEAKQKLVKAADVRRTAEELAEKAQDATLEYGALVNGMDGQPLAQNWREITRETGVLTVIYDDPATMLAGAIVASGKPFTTALAEVCRHYYNSLAHLGVRDETLTEWLSVADALGVTLADADNEP